MLGMSGIAGEVANNSKPIIAAVSGGFLLGALKNTLETLDINERGLRQLRGNLIRDRDFAWGFMKGDLYGRVETGMVFSPFFYSILKFNIAPQTEENDQNNKLELTCKEGKVTHGLQFTWSRIDEDWMLYRSHTSYKSETDMRQAFRGYVGQAIGKTAIGLSFEELFDSDRINGEVIEQTRTGFLGAGCQLHNVVLNQITFDGSQLQSNATMSGIRDGLGALLARDIEPKEEKPMGPWPIPDIA